VKPKRPLLAGPDELLFELSTLFAVDDDPWVRAMARDVAASVELPVECYANGEEFLAAYRPERPGCVVLDVRMPGMSGLDVQRELLARRARIPVIMITGYADVTMAVEALRAGAVEFLEKPFSSQTLIERIQTAMHADRYRRHAAARFAAFTERVVRLTQREREVLGLLVEGRPNKVIARQLALSCKTVETHRAKLMNKTGVESLAELIRFGLQMRGGPVAEPVTADE